MQPSLMRGLANYAMSGRYRALLIAVASSGSLLFGWIGCAVVALVLLRRAVIHHEGDETGQHPV